MGVGLGPLCGAALGLASGVAIAIAAPVSQLLVSAVASVLLIVANLVPSDADSPFLLGTVCYFLGLFFSYGLSSVVQLAIVATGVLSPDDLWTSGDWTGDAAELVRMPLFLALVCIFHATEFKFAASFHRHDLRFQAFLLSPVPAGGYSVAMVAAVVEFWLEELGLGTWRVWAPQSSGIGHFLLLSGGTLAFAGWAIRTAALFTAQSNFTHLVAWEKAPEHTLVTHGVYAWCRHPGYLGWFMWSVCTQVVLGNFFCLFAYGYVSWRFFAGRIPGEEAALLNFFREEYLDYARRVPCGVPYTSRLNP